jgi:hypothetical protein
MLRIALEEQGFHTVTGHVADLKKPGRTRVADTDT